MDQSITQWVNSFAGSNAILDWIMIAACLSLSARLPRWAL
jgi:hypothetical protein